MRHTIEGCTIEFDEGGNTIWVHGPQGATILRIKASGKLVVNKECQNICTHSDMIVKGDIEICVVEPEQKTPAQLHGVDVEDPEYADAHNEIITGAKARRERLERHTSSFDDQKSA